MLWKCSSNMVLIWKQTKNFVTSVLWEKHRQNFGTRTSRPNIVGEPINADVCGPETETSVGGTRCYAFFKDDYSKYHRLVFTIKSEVAFCLWKFLQEVKTAGHVTKVLLSDNGKEFNYAVVQKVLEEYSIMHRLTMTYTLEQNGATEQENRTIVESAHSLICAGGLPKELWAESCNTAIYLLNHTGPTPVEEDAFGTMDWIICNSWSLACFWDGMLSAHSQTEKAQVGPKEYLGSTGRIYGCKGWLLSWDA